MQLRLSGDTDIGRFGTLFWVFYFLTLGSVNCQNVGFRDFTRSRHLKGMRFRNWSVCAFVYD